MPYEMLISSLYISIGLIIGYNAAKSKFVYVLSPVLIIRASQIMFFYFTTTGFSIGDALLLLGFAFLFALIGLFLGERIFSYANRS